MFPIPFRPGALYAPLFALGMLAFASGGPAHAGSAAALVEALRSENADALKLQDWEPSDPGIAVLMPPGEAQGVARTGPWRMGVGAMSVEIAMRKRKDGQETASTPVLTLTVAGKPASQIVGEETYYDFPAFTAQIAEMDPGNPYPEILFSSYTGGAHCCSVTSILTSTPDGRAWRVVDAGTFDGTPILAQDPDYDGRYEIAEWDNRFLYAFGCYACSNAPLKIERLEGEKLVDVSRDPAFQERQKQYLKSMIQRADADMEVNSYLAGYVAQKMLLDEGGPALAAMRQHHDRETGIDYEQCSVPLDKEGNCKGEMRKLDFPAALERFLKDTGYN